MPALDLEDDPLIAQPKPAFARGAFVALGWGAAAAALAGGAWVVGVVAVFGWLKFAPAPNPADLSGRVVEIALLLGGGLAFAGAVVGAAVGFARGRGCRGATAAILATGGALFGAIGGSGCAMVADLLGPATPPLLSSAFVWALAGFLFGFAAFQWSSWLAARREENEDAAPNRRRVEWMLRDRRRVRFAAVVRVLPVLAVSGVVVGLSLTLGPNLRPALVAVGALGLSVALVMYKQECRLEQLERQQRDRKE